MRNKPILMGTPMAAALAAGRKTQTRRTKGLEEINKDPNNWKCSKTIIDGEFIFHYKNLKRNILCLSSKFKKGDILWVRETFCAGEHFDNLKPSLFTPTMIFNYKADSNNLHKLPYPGRWRPGIHMPKIVCRRFLEVTNVRAERLQDISEADSSKEGIRLRVGAVPPYDVFYQIPESPNQHHTAKQAFISLWISINGKKSWCLNPWVWVYEFKEVERPKNFLD